MPDMQPGDLIVLISVSAALFSGLPKEDQTTIRSVIGKPVKFAGLSDQRFAALPARSLRSCC